MVNFEDNWWMYFVPECFFDTLLLKRLLQTNKRLVHRKGSNNVVNDLDKRLKNSFAVALIDKDKRELNYLRECDVHYEGNKLVLLKHKSRKHFIIQLNPPLENWIIDVLEENGLLIEDFGYSKDYKKLKKQIKSDIDNESDERLNKLVNAIIKTDCGSIKKIKSFLHYLKEKNYEADINELKNA